MFITFVHSYLIFLIIIDIILTDTIKVNRKYTIFK